MGERGTTRKGDYPTLGVNEFGTPVSVHRCSSCGDVYTVCPPVDEERWGTGCLAETCPSYDLSRDVDLFFDALSEHGLIGRESVGGDDP